MSIDPPKNEVPVKVAIIGDPATGKTSLMLRFVYARRPA